MITHLLMDADHVLVNKPELWSTKYCREFGVDYAAVLPFFTGPFQAALVGRADLKEILEPWLERWNWTTSVDDFLHYWFEAEHFINSELLEEVERLREGGMKVYVATNQEQYRTEYMLHEMGFARQFDGMLASYDLGEVKPNPAFFATAYERLGHSVEHTPVPGIGSNPIPGTGVRHSDAPYPIPKSSILFWDNDAENVTGARAFGLRAERYETLTQFKQVMAELV